MTLPEMLVTIATFMFVMAAVFGLLDHAAEQQPKDQERAVAIREAQSGLHRMTRELRQAYKVLDAQPKSMYVLIGLATPPDKHVKYDCGVVHPDNPDYNRCLRWEAPVGQALPVNEPGEVVIDRGLSEVLFTYAPGPLNPNYVQTHLAVPQRGERKAGYNMNFVLEDGFYMRNLGATG